MFVLRGYRANRVQNMQRYRQRRFVLFLRRERLYLRSLQQAEPQMQRVRGERIPKMLFLQGIRIF